MLWLNLLHEVAQKPTKAIERVYRITLVIDHVLGHRIVRPKHVHGGVNQVLHEPACRSAPSARSPAWRAPTLVMIVNLDDLLTIFQVIVKALALLFVLGIARGRFRHLQAGAFCQFFNRNGKFQIKW